MKKLSKKNITRLLKDLQMDLSDDEKSAVKKLLNFDGEVWTNKLVLLAYLLGEDTYKNKGDYIKFALAKERDDAISGIFQFSKISGISKPLPLRYNPNECKEKEYFKGYPNAHTWVTNASLFLKDKKGKYELTFIGQTIALIIYGYLLSVNKIRIQDIFNLIDSDQKQPDDRLCRMKLIDEHGYPTKFAENLNNLLQRSIVFVEQVDDEEVTDHLVRRVQHHLWQMIKKTDSERIGIQSQKKGPQIKTENLFTLPICDSEEKEIDVIEWLATSSIESIKQPSSDEDDENDDFDEQYQSPLLILGEPGTGKSVWMAQSAVRLWNEQWSRKEIEDRKKWKRATDVIPLIITLRDVKLEASGHVLYYNSEDRILYSKQEENQTRNDLIANTMMAVLKPGYVKSNVEEVIKSDDWHSKDFVLFLDGWDELNADTISLMVDYVKMCQEYEISCVISSRNENLELRELYSDVVEISPPNQDDVEGYLTKAGMSNTLLEEIGEWFPNPVPLDLEVLSRFPKMEKVVLGRAFVYRMWIELQALHECKTDVPDTFRTIDELKREIQNARYGDIPLSGMVNHLVQSVDGLGEDDYSLWSLLPRLAYLQLEGKNVSISYDKIISLNPLMAGFARKVARDSGGGYPEIQRNHLVPYLSAEYIFRKYKKGHNHSPLGNSEVYKSLLEILELDLERKSGQETTLDEKEIKQNARNTAAYIILDAEAKGKSCPLKPMQYFNQEPFYTSLHYAFVMYWRDVQHESDSHTKHRIIESFQKLLERNARSQSEIDPGFYLELILGIEREIGAIIVLDAVEDDKPSEDHIIFRNNEGFAIGYIPLSKIDDLLFSLVKQKNWFLPWIIRLVDDSTIDAILPLLDSIPDSSHLELVYTYVFEKYSHQPPSVWFDSLVRASNEFNSQILTSQIGSALLKVEPNLTDDQLNLMLRIIRNSLVNESMKYKLVRKISNLKLTSKQLAQVLNPERFTKTTSKYYLAIGIKQENNEISLDTIFETIDGIREMAWLELIVPGLFDSDFDDSLVVTKFISLKRETISLFENLRLKPWEKERISELVEMWWEHNLTSVDASLEILSNIVRKDRGFVSDDDYYYIDFREKHTSQKLIRWLMKTDDQTKKMFLTGALDIGMDIFGIILKELFLPIYQSIDDTDELDQRIFDLYKDKPLDLPMKRQSWVRYIDQISTEWVVDYEEFMEYYIEAGHVETIEDAMNLMKQMNSELEYISSSFEVLSRWVIQRPVEDICKFTLCVLHLNIKLRRFLDTELPDSLKPVDKNCPELYDMLLKIVTQGDISDLHSKWTELSKAYSFLNDTDKLRIMRDQYHKTRKIEAYTSVRSFAEREVVRLGNDSDLKDVAKWMNAHPSYPQGYSEETRERYIEIYKVLTDPYCKMLLESVINGKETFLLELQNDESKAIMFLDSSLADGDVFWVDTFLKIGGVLRKIVQDRLFELPIDWAHHYPSIKYLEPDGDEKIIAFIAERIDESYIQYYEDYGDDSEDYTIRPTSRILHSLSEKHGIEFLKVLLHHLNQLTSIEYTLDRIIELQSQKGIPLDTIMETEKFNLLSSAAKWRLREKIKSLTTENQDLIK